MCQGKMFLNEKLDVIWKNETLKDPTRTVYTPLGDRL